MFDQAPPFWTNGPSPGALHDFPRTHSKPNDFFTHTQSPATTSSSIVAVTYDKGVIIAGDLLGSYGSLARYPDCPRVMKVNDNILIGADGDYADFQYLKTLIDQKIIDEDCLDDGIKLKPNSLHCWLTRILYQRRSKFDFLWNNYVIGGIQNGEPFLGLVDKLGTSYTDQVVCTGFGLHLAVPMLRDAIEKKPKLTKAEAKALVERAMEVLFYRDARSFPKYMLGIMDKDDGCTIEGPLKVKDNWEVAHMIRGYS